MGFISQPPQAGVASGIAASGVNAGTNVATLTPAVPTADGDIALIPKVNGAILADVPDGTAIGGNKRGIRAVDWQSTRSTAAQVASGVSSVIGGGENNQASGARATIAGGTGNTAGGADSTVGGGTGNNCTSQHGTISGGSGNTGTATSGIVIAGGQGNQAILGNYSTVGGGQSNVADALGATVPGGIGAATRLTEGRFSYSSFGSGGQAQLSELVTKAITADATVTPLTVDATVPDPGNTCMLGNNSCNTFSVLVSARSSGGDAKGWKIEGVIKRGANAAATALVGAPVVTVLGADAGAAAWTVAAVADTTRGSLEIDVTGAAATTIRWVARISLSEVTF